MPLPPPPRTLVTPLLHRLHGAPLHAKLTARLDRLCLPRPPGSFTHTHVQSSPQLPEFHRVTTHDQSHTVPDACAHKLTAATRKLVSGPQNHGAKLY